MPNLNLQASQKLILAAIFAISISGCGSDNSDNDTSSDVLTDTSNESATQTSEDSTTEAESIDLTAQTLVIDATAGGFGAASDDADNKYTYVDLDTDAILELTDDEAASNTAWDIAFKRTAAKLNGGESGSGSVTGGLLDAQEDFYTDGDANSSVFFAATAESELDAFVALSDVSNTSFAADGFQPYITGDGMTEASWWSYDMTTHTISANSDTWYFVRGASGDSYASLHATEVTMSDYSATFELQIQNVGETAFSTTPISWTATLGSAGNNACFDFDSSSEVDCDTEAANWDLRFSAGADGRSLSLWSNGGAYGSGSEGAAFGPIAPEELASFPSAASVAGWFSDSFATPLVTHSWYAYSLQGNHKLWPNYRTYAIDNGSAQYKVQVLSYYDEAGISGVITLRYAQL